MSLKKYRVTLSQEERDNLRELISQGKAAARKLVHARILLHADEASEAPCVIIKIPILQKRYIVVA